MGGREQVYGEVRRQLWPCRGHVTDVRLAEEAEHALKMASPRMMTEWEKTREWCVCDHKEFPLPALEVPAPSKLPKSSE